MINIKFFLVAITVCIATNSCFVLRAIARVPDSKIGCRAWDPNDTYVNVRRSPNGTLVKSIGNGSWLETSGRVDQIAARSRDSHGREWTLFNGHGWVLSSLLSCEVMS